MQHTFDVVRHSAFLVLICYSCLFSYSVTYATEYHVIVNSTDLVRDLHHFWRSTGFCPPLPHQDAYKFDYGKDMRLNLALIGSTAHSGIEQVRIHWLLDLVSVKQITNEKVNYDFSKLDDVIDILWENGLKPGFELMGNPSELFSDFENKTQVYMWKDLVEQLAKHYVDQYGLSYVSTWNFETWNEPDCKDFDTVKMTPQGFVNYYDASWVGLKSVSKLLILGGPGDGCISINTDYSTAFLYHIAYGNNSITGKNASADYLSFHSKGSGSSHKILEEEMKIYLAIGLEYPYTSLMSMKFFNDEADPMGGWSKDEWWRADATYAAIVPKVIHQHQNLLRETLNINFTLLSNDNGFLSYYPRQFTQRTLMARFQINNTAERFTQFVRKPVHSVMSLLALLGEKQLRVKLLGANDSDRVGALASYHEPEFTEGADSKQIVVLVFNSDDTSNTTMYYNDSVTVTIYSNFTENDDVSFVQYAINNEISNPYAIWRKYGKPDFPTPQMFKEMRKQEGPIIVSKQVFKAGTLTEPGIRVDGAPLPMPGIRVTHMCAKSVTPPDQTTEVKIYNITAAQILITWSDSCVNSKCIYRYDVEYSPTSSEGPYKVINSDEDSMITSFVYAPMEKVVSDEVVRGFYRVRAVDYFDRPGQYSLPQKYPS